MEVRFDDLSARNMVPGAKAGGLFTVGKDFVGKVTVRIRYRYQSVCTPCVQLCG